MSRGNGERVSRCIDRSPQANNTTIPKVVRVDHRRIVHLIESVAYDQVYDPTMIDTNYLGDSGIVGLGTSVDTATYSFTVPAGHNFVIVVNTTGGEPTSGAVSSPFSGTVSGFVNNDPGPGDCSHLPTPTPSPSPTPTPVPTPTDRK